MSAKMPAEDQEELRNYIESLCLGLVDDDEDVLVKLDNSSGVLVFTISCMSKDRGRLIGKQGKIIESINRLAAAAAGRLAIQKINVILSEKNLDGDKS